VHIIPKRVRKSVAKAVDKGKELVDDNASLQHQVERHPWVVVGVMLLIGYRLGRSFGGARDPLRTEEGQRSELGLIVKELLRDAGVAMATQLFARAIRPGRSGSTMHSRPQRSAHVN
jgi:hypothetical protein